MEYVRGNGLDGVYFLFSVAFIHAMIAFFIKVIRTPAAQQNNTGGELQLTNYSLILFTRSILSVLIKTNMFCVGDADGDVTQKTFHWVHTCCV